MASVRVFLIVSSSADVRITKRRPSLRLNEIAFPITVQIPEGWNRVYDELGLTLTIPDGVVAAPVADEPEVWLRSGDREL